MWIRDDKHGRIVHRLPTCGSCREMTKVVYCKQKTSGLKGSEPLCKYYALNRGETLQKRGRVALWGKR